MKASLTAAVAALCLACGGGGAASSVTDPAPPATPGQPGNPPAPPAPPAPPTPPSTPAPPTSPPSTSAPMTATISTYDRYFVETNVRIAVGGKVTFVIDDNRHDILFSPAPQEGNILDIEEGESATRTFTTAGTYTFHCDRHEDGGTITVVAASTTPPPTGPAPPTGPTPPPPPPPSGPAATITTPGSSFSPATVTIQAGQTVLWQISGARHNVTFRGAQPVEGSIPDTDSGRSVTRTFATAGTYPYDCTRHSGMSGTVIVQ